MNLASALRPYRVKDLRERQFGRLHAVHVAGRDRQSRALWACVCACGMNVTVPSRHLVNGKVVSCGCLGREVAAENGRRGRAKISGARSHLFNPALTEEHRRRRRNLVELRGWRRCVFERDDYVCDVCGVRGGRLQAHHLDCWSAYPNRRFDVSNGVTLCRAHHRTFHNFMGGPRKPCTESDYRSWRALTEPKRTV